jgi:amino acid permease
VIAIAIMGSVISSVISCVGEMTALMPVNAPMMEFPRRFLDRGVGFAVGWVYWSATPIPLAALAHQLTKWMQVCLCDIGGRPTCCRLEYDQSK